MVRRESEAAQILIIAALVGLSLLALMTGASATRPAAQATPTPELAYLPLILRQPTATPTTVPNQDWLWYLNQYRAQANLIPLVENSEWSQGGLYHSRYMVKNDEITHYEDPTNEWYTPEGAAAGPSGNIMLSSWVDAPDETAIDFWMTAPFHALSILDPKLQTTGFGSYRENIGVWKMGATLDTLRGRGALPLETVYPLPYPQDGGESWPLSFGGGEWPDPLTACPDYSPPTGAPVILQIGSGELTPAVTTHNFIQGEAQLEHCVFDESTYSNPDPYTQSIGRLMLDSRDAIMLLPRHPLAAGETYQASITVNEQTISWSFTTANEPLEHTWPAGVMVRGHQEH